MIAAIILSLAVSVPVALLFIGSATSKAAAMPRQVVVDAAESLEYCAQALPESITAVVSYDDLDRALRLHMEWIQAFHWTPESTNTTPVVFDQNDPTDYMLERCDIIGLDIDAETIAAIMNANYDYLEAKGALDIQPTDLSEHDLSSFPLLEN